MRFYPMLLVLLGLSFVLQEFVPAVPWAYNARLLLVPVVYFASAVAVPFPVMLVLAFCTGFVWDARHLIIMPGSEGEGFGDIMLDSAANPSFGYSILLYSLLGSLMQGIRPLFRRGRWELPVLMTGIGTGLLLIIEHLWICFLRGRFFFSEEVWMNIGSTALLSMMVSPVLFLMVHWLSGVARYQIRYEGIRLQRLW